MKDMIMLFTVKDPVDPLKKVWVATISNVLV